MAKRSGRLHIGTSGWHYMHWIGPFYPVELRPPHFLEYYAGHFHTVEINNSFYHLPRETTLMEWEESAPKHFVFSVKANRYITHMKKLKDPAGPVSRFMDRVELLEKKLGPILFQLPPRWKCNPARLCEFLEVLPPRRRYAFEFRDPTWFDSRVYDALKKSGTAFCIYDFAGRLSPIEVTADFVYVRLHGPGGPYQGQYTEEALTGWARAFKGWAAEGRDVYCYFDNDQLGYAPRDALRLREMLKR